MKDEELYLDSEGLEVLWDRIKTRSIPVKFLSKEEYEALSEEEKHADILYIVNKDKEGHYAGKVIAPNLVNEVIFLTVQSGETKFDLTEQEVTLTNLSGDSTISEEFANQIGLGDGESRKLKDVLGSSSGGGGGINRNLLDNWYWEIRDRIINRSGNTSWSAVSKIFDRWQCTSMTNAKIELIEDGVSVSGGTGYFSQQIDSQSYLGKELTFSALFSDKKTLVSVTGICPDSVTTSNQNFGITIFETGEIQLYCLSSLNGGVLQPQLKFRDDGYIVIAAKLELGPVQTLAHKEGDEWVLNEIPNYAEQYAICEQYSPLTGEFVGSQHSNPNLLTNWYFIGGGSQQGGGQFPINQRGEIENINSSVSFFIDFWRCYGETTTWNLTKEGIKVNRTSSTTTCGFQQRLEGSNCLKPLTTYTLSFFVKVIRAVSAVAISYGETINDNTGSSFLTNNIEYGKFKVYSYTFTTSNFEDTGFSNVRIRCSSVEEDDEFIIAAAKLELGPVQTLAHKEGDEWVLNDPPPDFQQELAKCQTRQVQLLDRVHTGQGYIGQFEATNATNIYGLVPLPVPLRNANSTSLPTIVTDLNETNGYEMFGIQIGGYNSNEKIITGVTVYSKTATGIVLRFTGSNFVAGNFYTVFTRDQRNHNFLIDANL